MKLIKYIKAHHNGNISAFAKSQGVLPSQAHRWINRDCEVHNGQVWCKVTKQIEKGLSSKR